MITGFSPSSSSPMILLLWSLLLLLVYYVLKYIKQFAGWVLKVRRIAKALQHFPGPPKHWLYGNLHLIPGLGEKGLAFFRDQAIKYPKLYTLWFGPARPILIICHPETIKVVLKSTLPKPVSCVGGYNLTRPWFGDGLSLSSGQKWFRNRRLLTPAFHFDVLKPYMKIYNQAAEILMEKFSETNTKKQSLDVFSPVGLCTLDVILKCAFSSDMDVQRAGDNHPYVNALISMSRLILKRALNPLMYPSKIYYMTPSGRVFNKYVKMVHGVSSDVINKRMKRLKENPENCGKRYPDFLDILLLARDEDGSGLTDGEIRDEVGTFLFAGHDTTSSAISWALHTLAQHPEYQQKCYEEISAVLTGRSSLDIELDDLGHLPYLAMCIKESLRLHTPVPIIGRQVETEFEMEGVTLPTGTLIDVHIHQMHINKAVWGEDCQIFKPDRFKASASADGSDMYAFVPFSAGPRNCIGQTFAMHEIKVIIARIIGRYHMTIDPVVPALHLAEVVMTSEKGLYLYFESRQSSTVS